MKSKLSNVLLFVGVGLVVVPLLCYAAATQTVNVRAVVPSVNSLNLTVSRIQNLTWTNATSMDFGTLTFDTTNHIFTSPYYYAVDCGVVDNSGNVWTLTHTATNFASGNNTLNSKVNVDFMRQNLTNANGTVISERSYANASLGVPITKTQLGNDGWLRIYYGLGTGSGDNPGVTPINSTQASGTYTGSVTVTLTP